MTLELLSTNLINIIDIYLTKKVDRVNHKQRLPLLLQIHIFIILFYKAKLCHLRIFIGVQLISKHAACFTGCDKVKGLLVPINSGIMLTRFFFVLILFINLDEQTRIF